MLEPPDPKEILYYRFRNKLYMSVYSESTDSVDIYKINRLVHPSGQYDYLEKSYHRRLSKTEFTRFVHKFGLMLWEKLGQLNT